MDKYVQQLIKLDEETKRKIKSVEEKRDSVKQVILKDKQVLEADLFNQMDKKLADLKREIDLVIEKDELDLSRRIQDGKTLVKKTYENNHSKWEEEIFNRCVGNYEQ